MKFLLLLICLLGIEASFLEVLKKTSKPISLAEDPKKKHHNHHQSSSNGHGGSHEFIESLRHNVVQGKDNILQLLQQQSPYKPTAASKSMQRFEEKTKKDKVLHVVAAAPVKSSRPSLRNLFATKGGANKKKRVLILMSDTGGGHRASAVAIDKAMSERIPGKVDVTVMDIWTDHAKWPFNNFVPYYRFLAKHPLLWRGMYVYGAFPPTKLFTETWSWLACYKSFKKAIVDTDPDLVVSVHPLCQLMPISIVKDMNKVRSKDRLPIPFVTVVTDLGGAHSTWFDRRTDMCFVPSEAVRKIALKNRVQSDKIVMHGLPIRPAFWRKPKAKATLRKALDLKQNVRSVLLMGGGDGVGGLEQITVELANRLKDSKKESQIVVICGHNKVTSDSLNARKWPANVRVVPKGFQKNIDEFMAACDLLVTKAGPGTIAEAMVQGLPMVLSSFLPGQEAGNVPYVVEGGFGVWSGTKPKNIAKTVYNLFNEEGKLEKMSALAKQKSRPEATRLISKDIGDIALRKTPELPIFKSSM